MIFSDILRGIGQIPDPRFRRVLAYGLGLTVALLAGLYIAVVWLVGMLFPDTVTLPFIGEVTWLHSLAEGGSLVLAIFVSSFLMFPVASAFIGLFLDQIADAVEEEHYPHLGPAKSLSFLEQVTDALGFFGVMIAANLLALVLYLLMPPLAPFIFWGMNGFLLGREYFQLVAIRRLGPEGARQLRRRFALPIWILGALLAVPLSIPIVNLFVPIVGAAAFTHYFHRVARD